MWLFIFSNGLQSSWSLFSKHPITFLWHRVLLSMRQMWNFWLKRGFSCHFSIARSQLRSFFPRKCSCMMGLAMSTCFCTCSLRVLLLFGSFFRTLTPPIWCQDFLRGKTHALCFWWVSMLIGIWWGLRTLLWICIYWQN